MFTTTGLQKCNEILMIRKLKGLKYQNVTLPETTGGSEGYHPGCYRRFTALNKNYMSSDPDASTSTYTTRSNVSDLPTTSTGVLMKVCIFCEKKDKKHNGRKQPLVNAETKNIEKKIK